MHLQVLRDLFDAIDAVFSVGAAPVVQRIFRDNASGIFPGLAQDTSAGPPRRADLID